MPNNLLTRGPLVDVPVDEGDAQRADASDATAAYCLHHALRVTLNSAAVEANASDENIHAARKKMKRIRAALRLLRASLGERAYRRANRQIRDSARLLRPVRDAAVLLQSITTLRSTGDSREIAAYLRRFQHLLTDEGGAARARLTRAVLQGNATALRHTAKRIEAPAQRPEATAVQRALKQAYKEGRVLMKRARKHSHDRVLHEWRKQVQYLLNEVDLVSPLFWVHPKNLRPRLEELACLLGTDHDLAVLGQKIRRFRRRSLLRSAAGAHRTVKARIEARRTALARKFYRLGERLYARPVRRWHGIVLP